MFIRSVCYSQSSVWQKKILLQDHLAIRLTIFFFLFTIFLGVFVLFCFSSETNFSDIAVSQVHSLLGQQKIIYGIMIYAKCLAQTVVPGFRWGTFIFLTCGIKQPSDLWVLLLQSWHTLSTWMKILGHFINSPLKHQPHSPLWISYSTSKDLDEGMAEVI